MSAGSEATVVRCSDASRAAGEPLHATAPSVTRWLLVEAPGGWPRDVGRGQGLPAGAGSAVAAWLERTPGSRLLHVRRPRRSAAGVSVFVVRSEEHAGEVRRLELGAAGELAHADLDRDGQTIEQPLVLVCGHGSRDACCARRGAELYAALERELPEEALWFSSHHGGHRFAPNVLLLPLGLHFGRVDPAAGPAVVASALAGRIELELYRGRTCYDARVQAAEHAVRTAYGVHDVHGARLAAVEDDLVRFVLADGSGVAATVEERVGPAVPASCGEEPAPQGHLRATVRAGA
ncbi:MAG TPA: sucrase ferredoxin [Gaiellaceae bacterium]|nr:sucrase ferredoxin [Gaiellaceae bacterium]